MQRTKSLFNKKIKCLHCGSYFKKKNERSKVKYICSSYDNKGECIRIPIEEDFLVELIQKRLNKEVTREVVDEHVNEIIIEGINPYLLEMQLNDQESILFSRDGIRF